MLRSRRPRGHAFLDKYRPRAPGGLQLQRPGKGETKSLPGAGEGQPDTWCGRRGAGLPRGAEACGGGPGGPGRGWLTAGRTD